MKIPAVGGQRQEQDHSCEREVLVVVRICPTKFQLYDEQVGVSMSCVLARVRVLRFVRGFVRVFRFVEKNFLQRKII